MAENLFGYKDTRGESEVTYNVTPLSTAPAFSTETAYVIGDLCFYGGTLYRFKANKTAGSWDSALVDAVTVKQVIKKESDTKAPAITESASGSLVTISDGADGMPVAALSVGIEPVQDLHGYDNPWPAGGGKNLIPDGTDTNNGYVNNNYINDIGGLISNTNYYVSEYFPVSPSTTYTLSKAGSTVNVPGISFYDSEKTYISSTSFLGHSSVVITTPATASYARCSQRKDSENLIQFELGSTATTPMPYSNICPITGWTSANVTRARKNLLDTKNTTWKKFYINSNVFSVLSDSSDAVSYTINNDYSISASNSSTYRGIGFNISAVNYDRIISISDTESGDNSLRLYSSYTTGASSIRSTTASSLPIYAGESGFLCVLFKTSGTHEFTLQLELGSTATAYEAPSIQTVTIDLGEERYGGTLNVLTGVLTVTHGMKTENGSANYTMTDTGKFYINEFFSGSVISRKISNLYKYGGNTSNPLTDKRFYSQISSSYSRLWIYDTSYSSSAELKAALALNPLQVVYELATPPIQLTPAQLSTILGENHIWADTGDTAVTYRVDSNLYIDQGFYTKDETDNAIDSKAPVITETVSDSIATFTDGAEGMPVQSLTVGIEPVQDLHGYDNPWPAGGGKNLLPLTVSEIKSLNTSGTWSGNAYTYRGITYTILLDSAENVIGIELNGTSNADWATLTLPNFSLSAGSYELNGSTGGSSDTYRISVNTSGSSEISQYSAEVPFTIDSDKSFTGYITVRTSGTTVSNVKIYPMIRLSSVTDATFAPYENICPISGFSQANVTRTGVNLVNIPDFTSTSSARIANTTGFFVKAGTYTFSFYFTGTTSDTRVQGSVTADYQIAQGNYALPNSKGGVVVDGINGKRVSGTLTARGNGYFHVRTVSQNVTISNIQLELGSTATAYEAPSVQTVTIDLDGTRYGGTVDVLTGMLTVTHASQTVTGNDFDTQGTSSGGINYVYNTGDLITPSSKTNGILKCNTYTISDNGNNNNTVRTSNGNNLIIYDNRFTDLETAQGILNTTPCQIYYELATPVTVQLSANTLSTLKGQNHIWADTGNVAVEYLADTKLYIQKLTQPTEDDMVANDNIAANTFFMVGNTLYFSTEAIATGTTITPGSNCTQMSLADALNQLNA